MQAALFSNAPAPSYMISSIKKFLTLGILHHDSLQQLPCSRTAARAKHITEFSSHCGSGVKPGLCLLAALNHAEMSIMWKLWEPPQAIAGTHTGGAGMSLDSVLSGLSVTLAPCLRGSLSARPGHAKGLVLEDCPHCGLPNVCLSPSVVGAILHAAKCHTGLCPFKGPIQCTREPQILPRRADEAYRPFRGFWSARPLTSPLSC